MRHQRRRLGSRYLNLRDSQRLSRYNGPEEGGIRVRATLALSHLKVKGIPWYRTGVLLFL